MTRRVNKPVASKVTRPGLPDPPIGRPEQQPLAAAEPAATAAWLKWVHPMRTRCYLFSEQFNPWMAGIAELAPGVRTQRKPVSDDDPFLLAERSTSEQTSAALEAWRKFQKEPQERIFHALYG